MPPTYVLRMITDLKPGDHLCCLYETEEEHRAVLTLFLRQGLEQDEKVLYIVDTHTVEAILDYLRDDGLEVDPYLERGQLKILTVDDTYMRDGRFDPDGMIALLRSETEQALAEGYTALRVTGEMTWTLRRLSGSDPLIEYEAKLNSFFHGSKCLAICQYDQRHFDPAVLLEVLITHPKAVIGTEVYENFFYIPPTELLGDTRPAATLRHWIESLIERKRAETALQAKTHALDKRVKELNCLYAISQLVEHPGISLVEILQGIVECIPPAWQYPDITSARIIIEGQEFKTENFRETLWKQTQGILVQGERLGTLEVCYLEEKSESEEGPFLKEERSLLNMIAERVGRIIERNQAVETLQQRTVQLQEINAELETFAYSVSHDLRAPLRTLYGFSQALVEDYGEVLEAEGRDYAQRLVGAAKRLDTIILDLLTYSRLGRSEMQFKPVDLESVCEETLGYLEVPIRRKDAQITIKRPLPKVMGHHATLLQVMENLLSNAIKFVAPGVQPAVRVWAEERDEWVRLWVQDNGIGIAPEHHERIFRPFERLHSIETYPSTGLGLAIVTKGMKRMGGQVGVESALGKGSKFWVELPKVDGKP